jgi:outer membrane autotransporter protein
VAASHVRLTPDVDLVGSPRDDLDVWQLQVGLDRPVGATEGGTLIAGATFSYGGVDTRVASGAGNGGIETQGYGLGATLTWLGGSGLYLDGQAQLAWYDTDLSSTEFGDDLASDAAGFGYAIGIEGGRRLRLNGAWAVTPQVQAVYSSVDFDSFVDPFAATVALGEGASLPLRLGISLDQDETSGGGRHGRTRSHLYGIANIYWDLLGETSVRVGGTPIDSQADRLWGSVGLGGTYSWRGGAYAIYGEGLVGTSLSSLGDDYASKGTLGFRIAW